MTKMCQVSDVSEVIDSTHKTPYYHKSGTPMLRATDIKLGAVSTKNCKLVDEKTYNEFSKRYRPSEGDIVITRVGTYGNISYVGDSNFCLGQNVSAIVPKKINAKYLYYVLASPHGKREIENLIVGSTQKTLSLKAIKSLSIPRHGDKDEKAIAHILGTLDEKIEVNQKMNETLEEIAQAIFKSWFVDFDPVRAKAAGKIPAHMDADIAAFFPSSFGDDRLPVGFSEKSLKDFGVEIESGKRPKGGIDKSLSEGIPSIGAESLQKIGDFDLSKVKFVKEEFAEKICKGWAQNYDVAIYKDGANVGDPTRVGLFGNGFPFEKFMVNEHVFLLRSKELGQPFLNFLCSSERLSQQLHSMGTSKAAQPGLNQKEVLSCKFVAPPQSLLSAFNQKILPLINRRLCLGLENKTLAELRDTLLPKLISGEIRVKDAERKMETAI